MRCPNCDHEMCEIKYRGKGVHDHDGPSEWNCVCGYREGYFCRRELTGDEVEPFDCNCIHHPKFVVL